MEQKRKLPKPGEVLLVSRYQDSPQKVSQVLTVLGETEWTPAPPNSARHCAEEIGGPSLTCPVMLLTLLDTDFDGECIWCSTQLACVC